MLKPLIRYFSISKALWWCNLPWLTKSATTHETGFEGVSPSNEFDRISELPDNILHHILSFVDTIDVVRLSVVSQRWKSLWITIPYLNFDFNYFQKLLHHNHPNKIYAQFNELITNVIMSHDSTNYITRIRLINIVKPMCILLPILATTKACKNVQEFELINCKPDFKYNNSTTPSLCLTNFQSLQVLKLNQPMCILLPIHLKFKHLTSLHIHEMCLIDEELTRKLFLECTSLQDLSLINCYIGMRMKVLDISSSSLKRLIITHKRPYEFLSTEIRISCPTLHSFTYKCPPPNKFSFKNISSLDYMCIELFSQPEDTLNEACDEDVLSWFHVQVGHLVYNIFEQVENIRVLELHDTVIKYLFHYVEALQCFPTKFHELKFLHLSLTIDRFFIKGMCLFLKHCPNLESLTLIINEIEYTKRDYEYCEAHHELIKVCWGSCLKSVQFTEFSGEEHEFRFLKFLLKNALVLEKMVIICTKFFDNSLTTNERIMNLPKASSLAQVKIIVPFESVWIEGFGGNRKDHKENVMESDFVKITSEINL